MSGSHEVNRTPSPLRHDTHLPIVFNDDHCKNVGDRQLGYVLPHETLTTTIPAGQQTDAYRSNGDATASALSRSSVLLRLTASGSIQPPPMAQVASGHMEPNNNADNTGDDNNHGNFSALPPPPPGDGEEFLACPLYKFDPHKYFRCLQKYNLTKFAYVVQHLERCHILGGIYCWNCWTEFRKQEDLQAHLRTLPRCASLKGPERLWPAELTGVNKDRKLSDEEKWFRLWEKLFLGLPKPASAYVKDGLAGIRDLGHSSLLSATQELLRIHNPSWASSLQEDPDSGELFVSDVIRVIFDPPTQPPRRRRHRNSTPGPDDRE
ncbi:hypothetical protein B0H66DRAFT_628691 [Apodospora peruviana]|uniref:C2H2-type domain-containing protein n=1 Tax=Apodospora peruviana TaxID=516989 RepID=A0AAE0I0W4_9PEZI|nr:hypothetical protein B0H66DRAFT_628691 [Apodospora peruviana]